MDGERLHAEVHALARQLGTSPENVAEFAAMHGEEYQRTRYVLIALLNVEAVARHDERPPGEYELRTAACSLTGVLR